MRGEKVDLESIKNTIKNDLEGVKGRAREMGNDMKEKAQVFGQQFKTISAKFWSGSGANRPAHRFRFGSCYRCII